MTLNPNEQQFLLTLSALTGNSVWNIAIKNVVDKPEPWKVRRLIADLRSQAADDSEVMCTIIGEPGLQQLMAM